MRQKDVDAIADVLADEFRFATPAEVPGLVAAAGAMSRAWAKSNGPLDTSRLAKMAARDGGWDVMAFNRSEIIEALSWNEDMERGRWGHEYAREVLRAYEATTLADLRAERDALIAQRQSWADLAADDATGVWP